MPEAELKSPHRICFQVEQAHWFYEDFVRLLQPNLQSFQLKTFSEKNILFFILNDDDDNDIQSLTLFFTFQALSST